MTRHHVVLLGDSIFDNAAYVPNGPAVIDHLRQILLPEGRATLLARDGDVVGDIADQLLDLPPDVTHLVLSVGGNDALAVADVGSFPAGTVNDALRHLTRIRLEFLTAYRKMLRRLIDLELPLAVCTIYEAIPGLTEELQTALCVFNDSIIREALAARLPIIDLRAVCTEAGDYSGISPIEPSGQGGRKIAQAIREWIKSHV
ncbi:MAG: SGNH/GDSL hydrolase family protein [Zoogloeaceae bacterium]|nr:SGNH/GDSL hydrolase family protein [Zoogloeaceae bacterium]